jgi:flagellar export protein FliJ
VGPFRFRLASVLTVWRRREDAALGNLQRQRAVVQAAEARVTAAIAAREAAQREAAGALCAASSASVAGDPAWHRNWIVELSARIAIAREARATALEQERAALRAWQTARRDVRVLERLEDRARARHQVETTRADLRQMDALAALRAPKGQAW